MCVQAAIVKVAPKTTPVCKCKAEMVLLPANLSYNDATGINCDGCSKSVSNDTPVWHCPKNKSYQHRNGMVYAQGVCLWLTLFLICVLCVCRL